MDKLETNYRDNLSIDTFGIHSCRYSSMVIFDDFVIYPTCGKLNKYSISKKAVEISKFISHSVIMGVKRHRESLVVLSYNGEIRVLDLDLNIRAKSEKLPNVDLVSHFCINDDFSQIAIGSDYYNDSGKKTDGMLVVFDVSKDTNQNVILKPIFSTMMNESFCEFNEENDLFVLSKRNISEKEYCYEAKLLSTKDGFKLIKENNQLNQTDKITQIMKDRNTICVNYLKRVFKVLDLSTLEVIFEVKIEGSGAIGDFHYSEGRIYMTPTYNKLISIDINRALQQNVKTISLPKVLKDVEKTYDFVEAHLEYFQTLEQQNYSLKIDNSCLVWSNEQGFFGYNLEKKELIFSLHSIVSSAACGLAQNNTLNLIAVGDLGFNLAVFDPTVSVNSEGFEVAREFLGTGIRCIEWDEVDNIIFIGTMEGMLFIYDMNSRTLQQATNLLNTITLVKFFNLQQEMKFIAASTTGGELFIFKVNVELGATKLMPFNSFCAHEAQKDNTDQRFGSLRLYSEIWSLTFNKNSSIYSDNHSILENFMIATSSEDQTVNVWKANLTEKKTPEKKHCMKNHSLAVTCVDWKNMNALNGEVFISISDDRTVQVYDPLDDFKLIKTLTTFDCIHSWHTLTYAALEENGTHLACATQNGYLVVWNLKSFQVVFCERIHFGGLEGLTWKGSRIVVCSSDLNVSQIFMT